MNAKDARTKYFEKYIEFEHSLRFLAGKMKVESSKESMHELISKVAASPVFPMLGLSSSVLIKHKNVRNWLSHSHKNVKASENQLKCFKAIDKLNKKILEVAKKIKTTSKERSRQ